MISIVSFLAGSICAYLAGSVNFSILLFRLLGKDDPRSRFSGNPGVTNVFRQAGWLMAAVILLLDVGRAAAVAFLARHYWETGWVPWAGLALIMGNHFPCFHGFRGGKGVANHLGFYAVLLPLGAGLAALTYVAVFAMVRIPFIGSFGMLAVLAGFGVYRWAGHPFGAAAVVITALCIVWFHRTNLAALIQRRKSG